MISEIQASIYDRLLPGWREAPLVSGNRRVSAPYREDRHPSLDVHERDLVWFDRATGEGGGAWDLAVRTRGAEGARGLLREIDDGAARPAQSECRRSLGPGLEVVGPATPAQIEALRRSRRLRCPETLGQIGAKAVMWKGSQWLGIPARGGCWKLWAINQNGVPRLDAKGKLERRNIGAASFVASPSLLSRRSEPISRLWDVEGESDFLAAIEAGVEHVVASTGGAGAVAPYERHGAWLLERKPAEVVVVRDRDEAGRRGAEEAASWWRTHGVPARVIELGEDLGEGGDLRDFLNGSAPWPGQDGPTHEALGTLTELESLADASRPRQPTCKDEREETCQERSPVLVCMEDVEPEAVRWLWEPYLPRCKTTLLEGDPGLGKTWLALSLAAAVSQGWPLPGEDSASANRRTPSDVLYMTAEDGLTDTLRPRLDAAGADVARIHILDGYRDEKGDRREVTLADLDVLEVALTAVQPALVVVDPIQGFLGAGVDMHRANEVRPLLAALGRLAHRFGCAVLAIRHLRKSSSDRAVYRGLGSIDFSAAVRSILLVGEDPEDSSRRLVAHAKSNLAPPGPTVVFEIRQGEFRWAGNSGFGAEELLAARDSGGSRKGEREGAEDFLLDVLAGGPVSVPTIKDEAKDAGLSWRTVERAKKSVGAEAHKSSFCGSWQWSLPASPQDRQGRSVGGLGGLGGETNGERVSHEPPELIGGLGDEVEEGIL